jgi:hypothetical protein
LAQLANDQQHCELTIGSHAGAIICNVRHGIIEKVFVTVLLTLCLGAHLVELSSVWDRTIDDANDEVSIVSVVLCVGVALSAAGTLLNRIRGSRVASRIAAALLIPRRHVDSCIYLPILTSAASTSLRI